MLKQFNSNNRKLNRAVPKNIKGNTLDNDAYIEYLQSIAEAEYAEHNTNVRKTNSNVRSNSNSSTLTNNKGKINSFYQEILQYSAKYVKKQIDAFDNVANTLTLYNTTLDYGTETPTAENFEILTFGLHIPGDYVINQIDNSVVIKLNERYIDFDNITLEDIYVFGKFK